MDLIFLAALAAGLALTVALAAACARWGGVR